MVAPVCVEERELVMVVRDAGVAGCGGFEKALSFLPGGTSQGSSAQDFSREKPPDPVHAHDRGVESAERMLSSGMVRLQREHRSRLGVQSLPEPDLGAATLDFGSTPDHRGERRGGREQSSVCSKNLFAGRYSTVRPPTTTDTTR